MRYAGDEIIRAGRNGDFDTSNLAGKMGMRAGDDIASVRMSYDNDEGRITNVRFVNDNDPGVYAYDSNGTERVLGQNEALRNPVKDYFGGPVIRAVTQPTGRAYLDGTGSGHLSGGTLYQDVPVSPGQNPVDAIVAPRVHQIRQGI